MIQDQNLFDHQIKAVDELYKRKNVLLLRAMGSGKTAIALHLCKKLLNNSNAFILYVCPAHTIIQIFAEKQKWALDFQLFAPEKNYDYAKLSPGVYVLSYDRLRRYKDTFINFNWDLMEKQTKKINNTIKIEKNNISITIDESNNIKIKFI